jgi:hypothetical protein
MRDINQGWLLRYCHANVASFFFIFVYAHIGRALYYGSYKGPRVLPYSIGVFILVLMIGTAFLGYVLPYGQMSYWGYTILALNVYYLFYNIIFTYNFYIFEECLVFIVILLAERECLYTLICNVLDNSYLTFQFYVL